MSYDPPLIDQIRDKLEQAEQAQDLLNGMGHLLVGVSRLILTLDGVAFEKIERTVKRRREQIDQGRGVSVGAPEEE
jgi:hypothetical protein